MLDLACGQGRHTRWFAERGHTVVALDKSTVALQSLHDLVLAGTVQTVAADIEADPWPLMQHALWRTSRCASVKKSLTSRS